MSEDGRALGGAERVEGQLEVLTQHVTHVIHEPISVPGCKVDRPLLLHNYYSTAPQHYIQNTQHKAVVYTGYGFHNFVLGFKCIYIDLLIRH